MTHYFLQIIIFQALFLGIYELFLKKETFFSLNRAYLLVTPFLAAIIPLLEFEVLQNFVPVGRTVQLSALIISENSSLMASTPNALGGSSFLFNLLKTNWVLIAYSLGMVISFAFFLQKYIQLQGLRYSGELEKYEGTTLFRIPKSRIACTFFSTIFLGEDLSEEESEQILTHEMAHVEQKHSLDLLVFEMLRILLWFNPLIYRYQSQLSLLHEYIADEKVTQKSEKTTYFQDLLNSTFGTRHISFTNQFFNKSLIKKRILMLQKPKSNRIAKLKFLFIIPLLLAMLTYVACSEDKISTNNELQEIAPPPPPGPPEEAYETYLNIKNYMKAKGVELKFSFEEFQRANNSENGLKGKILPPPPPVMKGEVSFMSVEQVPVFPGCEDLENSEAQKSCMSKKIRKFVVANFEKGLGKKLGLTGKNRISVMFKINKNGEVVNVKAKAPHPGLKKEAIRVVSSLPQMIPGRQDGKPVGVLYSLPIIFQVD